MSINLRPHSAHPLIVEDAEYERLIKRAEGGWSRCADETEWLAKLHYLRTGYRDGKLTEQQFEERELRLVQGWLQRSTG
jgi:hypothetical protein